MYESIDNESYNDKNKSRLRKFGLVATILLLLLGVAAYYSQNGASDANQGLWTSEFRRSSKKSSKHSSTTTVSSSHGHKSKGGSSHTVTVTHSHGGGHSHGKGTHGTAAPRGGGGVRTTCPDVNGVWIHGSKYLLLSGACTISMSESSTKSKAPFSFLESAKCHFKDSTKDDVITCYDTPYFDVVVGANEVANELVLLSNNEIYTRSTLDCAPTKARHRTRNPTPSPTKSPTPSPTNSPTPSPTKSPTLEPTPGPTREPSLAPTITYGIFGKPSGPKNCPVNGVWSYCHSPTVTFFLITGRCDNIAIKTHEQQIEMPPPVLNVFRDSRYDEQCKFDKNDMEIKCFDAEDVIFKAVANITFGGIAKLLKIHEHQGDEPDPYFPANLVWERQHTHGHSTTVTVTHSHGSGGHGHKSGGTSHGHSSTVTVTHSHGNSRSSSHHGSGGHKSSSSKKKSSKKKHNRRVV
jgi:hypothetical protein